MVELLSWLSSVCHECTVAKWCKIGPRLLLITNKKSHTGFQMTLDDLEGRNTLRNGMFQAISAYISETVRDTA